MSKFFIRKLTALQFPQPQHFDPNNEQAFKNMILWVEDQKIRHYKIEDRKGLRDLKEPQWTRGFEKYLKDVGCPFPAKEKYPVLDYLLGLAVRLEYGDNAKKYSQVTGQKVQEQRRKAGAAQGAGTALHNISKGDPDFKAGLESIAKLLDIQLHEDCMVTLEAIRLLVEERLTPDAIEKAKSQKPEKKTMVPFKDIELGFDTGDPVLNDAAKALRLLHIRELRELQTKINEAIVSVQKITANPKTDQRLGKVGR